MRILVVSGIWPPDVGGPASHAPELAAFLRDRGHRVEAVVTADVPPAQEPVPVRYVSRRLPPGIRHAAVAALVARRAGPADVVYATSMLGRAALGARLARTPLVVKVTGDEAYERARRRCLFTGDLEAFQRARGGLRIRLLRAVRDAALGSAARVFCPSAYLRDLSLGWGLPPERVEVLLNPAPPVGALPSREKALATLGLEPPLLAFAGRLTDAKAVDVLLDAVHEVRGARLVLVGDGPDRPALEERARALGLDGRVSFLGARPRRDVLLLFRAADAAVLSSRWENFPHSVVEALAVGTPVVATAVGGVREVVRDGENGLLVPPGDPAALAAAISRLLARPALRAELAAAAAPSVAALSPERVHARIEATLSEAARRA